MKIENEQQLKDVLKKLLNLLEDPHPGLSTWCAFYASHMKTIVDYWNEN